MTAQLGREPLFRLDLPAEKDPIRLVLSRRVPWAIHDEVFSQQSFGAGPWPDQGWKLHVSATPLSAVEVLESSLDVLLAEGARFKVVGSISRLVALNSGVGGIPQIGKFLTVYPSDDAQAVRLAAKLDKVTRGRAGPRVPSDRPLRPDSLVHYRYGAMTTRREAQTSGEGVDGVNDVLDSAGRLIHDFRLVYYQPPAPAIVDPFEAAGVYVAPPRQGPLLNGRYLVNDALSQRPRGGVFRAVDVNSQPARLCLLKEAWHHVGLDQLGRDARDWAANEAKILSRYAGDPVLPRFYESFESGGNSYIAIEYLEGTPFDRALWNEQLGELGLDHAELIAFGLTTAAALAHLHEIGLVFRDFKPANIIRGPNGDFRLIDFGIAYEYRQDNGPPLSMGTPPYYPREQYEGEHPSPADDVFAWGAVLHHLAGGDASLERMQRGDDYLRPFQRSPIAEFAPNLPQPLAEVIDRAVAWERSDRYATMLAAREALAAAARGLAATPRRSSDAVGAARARTKDETPALAEVGPEEALRLAREIGDALCAAAEVRAGGLCWKTRPEWSDESGYGPDLYSGAAGTGLFLAELAHATGEERYADAARGAARWLAGPTWGRGRAQHGLHGGEPGVAYFYLRLAELLDEPGFTAAAELRMRRLRGASFTTVDLIYGTAGTLLALLALHRATAESDYLVDARTLGDHLVESALPATDGGAGCYWKVASAAPGGLPIPYLGLLHGAAGIALALAHLAAVTSDERYLNVVEGAAELLLAQARPSTVAASAVEAEAQEQVLTWPRHLGDDETGLQAHCHGAGGVGQFFFWLDRLFPDPRYRQAAKAAGHRMAAERLVEGRSGICHGVSGIGHFLIDCFQAFRDERWLRLARECGGVLQRFRSPGQPGAYAMHGQGAISPDLMLGYAGPGTFLLRLNDPVEAAEPILGTMNESLAKQRGGGAPRRPAASPS